MKRVFSFLVAGAVACGLFVGCASQNDATTNPSQSQTPAPVRLSRTRV